MTRPAARVRPDLAFRTRMSRSVSYEVSGERAVRGGHHASVVLRAPAEDVPGVLLMPPAARRPAAAALLVHGYGSTKERMSETIGATLLRHGIASLALDLPLHGERGEQGTHGFSDPMSLLRHWRAGLEEARLGVRLLADHEGIDRRRLATVGYSLGSFVALEVAATEESVRAVIVAGGGDFPPHTPFLQLIRTVADPIRAVTNLRGRPLLIVHGTRDRTVRPEQAQRLYDAASDPKEIRWIDTGHHLPSPAVAAAATWLVDHLPEP